MEFNEWLKMMGYFPWDRIKYNYRESGYSEDFIEEREEELKAEHKKWMENK